MKALSLVISILILLVIDINTIVAQTDRIESIIHRIEAESHLRFLTADELRGRNTGTIELNIAARYIAEQFRKSGVIPLGDEEADYLQRVNLTSSTIPKQAKLEVLNNVFDFGKDVALLEGKDINIKAPLILVEDAQNLDGLDLKGKIVVLVLQDLMSSFRNRGYANSIQNAGALGLIEIFSSGHKFPWPLVMQNINRKKISVGNGLKKEIMPQLWVRDSSNILVKELKLDQDIQASILIDGYHKTQVDAYNVVGKVKGTDTVLSAEHIVLCAHYDHVGIQSGAGSDSIYNGTRDNGIGTSGLINAARYFGKFPPKRSVILIALTGEEKGLLGSRYYTNNPKVPLEETVFALNIDNSGYTDTEVLTLLDTGRTNIDSLVYIAASEVGLGVIGDRIPNQNYYERSDQVSFASKGVPAVNFKMSMAAFDERISKYYHQPNDEFETVDLDYIYKYWIAYIRSAELIGNWNVRPYWIKGDKFEPAGASLYNK